MELCEMANQTLVVAVVEAYPDIAAVRDQTITGVLGSCYDKLLCRSEKRKCRLTGLYQLGVKLENSSYSGVLGEFQANKGDIFLRGEPNGIIEPWLWATNPFRSENIVALQAIHHGETLKAFDLSQNFLEFSSEIIISYLLAVIVIGCFCLFLNAMLVPSKHKGNSIVMSRTDVFSLFSSLFFEQSLLFLTNNIKTNAVVLDTSFLVQNKEDLMNSKKVICWYKDGTEQNIAMSMPKGTFLSRLFYERSNFAPEQTEERAIAESENCVVERKLGPISLIVKETLFLLSQPEAKPTLGFFGSSNLVSKAWMLDRGIHQFDLVIYYRRSTLNDAFMRKIFTRYSESGIIARVYSCIDVQDHSLDRRSIQVFQTLDQYVEEHNGFSDLDIRNFRTIFLAHFALLVLYLAAFLVSSRRKRWICKFFSPLTPRLDRHPKAVRGGDRRTDATQQALLHIG